MNRPSKRTPVPGEPPDATVTERPAQFAGILWPVVVGASLVGLAWLNRFVQDDAFISFVYARSLVEGDGLTWFGERIEGYTNFLWVIWLAIGFLVGLEPVLWATLGGLAAFAITLACLWKLALGVGLTRGTALLAMVLFGTNFSVSSYATGGLETMLQTALLCASAVLVQRIWSDGLCLRRTVGLSLTLAAAALTRLDSALPGLIAVIVALLAVRRHRGSRTAVLGLLLPSAVVIGLWLAWKGWYYGELLPNSFYAKVSSDLDTQEYGVRYIARFLHWYGIWPFLVAAFACAFLARRKLNPGVRFLLIPVLVWWIYVVRVGGDFMEFRFMIPTSPFLFLMLASLIHDVLGRVLRSPLIVSAVSVIVLGFLSHRHARSFTSISEDRTLDSIEALQTFYGRYPEGDWGRIGRCLGAEFDAANCLLALDATGSIPYYSRLPTVDLWGLNDAWVARNGEPQLTFRPGHRVYAQLHYLRERKVNLLIGHPKLIQPGVLANAQRFRPQLEQFVRSISGNVSGSARLLAIPIDDQSQLLVWYLTPSPEIDQLVEQRNWETATIQL